MSRATRSACRQVAKIQLRITLPRSLFWLRANASGQASAVPISPSPHTWHGTWLAVGIQEPALHASSACHAAQVARGKRIRARHSTRFESTARDRCLQSRRMSPDELMLHPCGVRTENAAEGPSCASMRTYQQVGSSFAYSTNSVQSLIKSTLQCDTLYRLCATHTVAFVVEKRVEGNPTIKQTFACSTADRTKPVDDTETCFSNATFCFTPSEYRVKCAMSIPEIYVRSTGSFQTVFSVGASVSSLERSFVGSAQCRLQ